jgi:Helix-turn-helix domain
MRKTDKFRLNPTRRQRSLLGNTLELCRWVYYETPATRKNAWEQALEAPPFKGERSHTACGIRRQYPVYDVTALLHKGGNKCL